MQLAQRLPVLLLGLAMLFIWSGAGKTATVTLNPGVRYQTMLGMGAFVNGWEPNPPGTVELFARDFGASILRLGIPASSLSPKADLDLDNLNVDKLNWNSDEMKTIIDTVRKFNANKVDSIKIIASVWSPPGWMKNTGGNSFGYLLPNYYDHYGKFLAAFATGFEARTGVPLYAVSIQNELQFDEWYGSCIYTPAQFRDTVKAVGAQFKKWHIATKIQGPETVAGSTVSVLSELDFINTTEADPDAGPSLMEYNMHAYASDGVHASGTPEAWKALRDGVQPYNKILWMTETSGQATKWPDALQVGSQIALGLNYGNVNAWVYWMFYNSASQTESLLAKVDPKTKKYAVAKQYYRYIRPGAVRIAASGDTDDFNVSAFVQDATHELTVVMINNGKAEEPVTINLPAKYGESPLQYWRTSATESFAALPDIQPDHGAIALTMPAQSIITLHGIGGASLTPSEATTPTNPLVKIAATTSVISWSPGWGAATYRVSRAEGTQGRPHTIADKLTGTSFTDQGLVDGQSYTYTVTAMNARGKIGATSTPITVTAHIAHATWTPQAPKLDAGTLDPAWDATPSYPLSRIVGGKLTGTEKLEASWKLLWDKDNLYALVEVKKNTPLRGSLADSWHGDCAEIFIDGDNSKQGAYTLHDFQYMYPLTAPNMVETRHNAMQGVTAVQVTTADGYRMVMAFPLSLLGAAPFAGNAIGFDAQVDDAGSPAEGRHAKVAWWEQQDNAWMDPSVFGTVILTLPTTGMKLPAVPTPPATLTATPEDFFAHISWPAQPDALGYVLKRGKTHGGPYLPIATIVNATSYEDRSIPDGQSAYYILAAFSTGGVSKAGAETAVTPTIPTLPVGGIAINCGGPAVDYFIADTDVKGGRTYTNYIGPIDRSAAHATAEAVYYSERTDAFTYTIPHLNAGEKYLVRLHFCENFQTQVGQRHFNVTINTAPSLTNFDILAEAHGSQHTAVVKDFTTIATADGAIVIDFTGNAVVNGIEILKK